MMKQHRSKDDFLAFQRDELSPEELIHFLEHTSSCIFCSQQLADCMNEDTITAPKDMKENILKETQQFENQMIHKIKKTSKRMELFLYSLKVGTATVGALLVLFFIINLGDLSNYTSNYINNPPREQSDINLTSTLRDNMNNFSNQINNFSYSILKTEDSKNEKKEK